MATRSSTGKSAASKTAKRSTASTKQTASAEKTAARKKSGSGRNYNPEASAYVGKKLKEMKQGKLKSGGDGKQVRNPKQAIAIGLSEARKAGAKVPANPGRKAA